MDCKGKEEKINLLLTHPADHRQLVDHRQNAGYTVELMAEENLLLGDPGGNLIIVDQILAMQHGLPYSHLGKGGNLIIFPCWWLRKEMYGQLPG